MSQITTQSKTQFQIIPKYLPVINGGKRYYILMGGRSGGRSHFASQYATARLRRGNQYFRCAVMRFILGDVRHSIFQDILDRLEEQGMTEAVKIRDLEIEFGHNSIKGMGFRKSSGDQKAKMKSLANFNCIIIEEADEVSEEDFIQLDDSIRKANSDIIIILMFNTTNKNHWTVKRWFNLTPSGIPGFYRPELRSDQAHNTAYIHTTYLDNLININRSTIDNFERYKETRPEHYYNMIMGLVSEGARGRIYTNWKPISDKEYDELPYPEIYGQDFGFTNDPTALIGIKLHNNKAYFREYIYETGLINKRIAERYGELKISRTQPIYADNSEPKSIEELRLEDWNVLPATKGQDSVNVGIDLLLGLECYYTESSTNIAREQQEYKWALDRNKEPTNTPVDKDNHCFAGNTLIHTTQGKIKIEDLVGRSGFLYSVDGLIKRFSNVRATRKSADMLNIEFEDGKMISVTPDHLLLRPDGNWIEARLLSPTDLIQSVMYENTNIQWKDLQKIQWGKIFLSWVHSITQSYLGILQWKNIKGLTRSSQEWKYRGQPNREFGVEDEALSLIGPSKRYVAREVEEDQRKHGKDKTANEEMAFIKRGEGVAQITWDRSLQEKKTLRERMCVLPYEIYNYAILKIGKVLSSELQDESTTKKITRITRGFSAITYNLDVEDTECLLANGVVAHNCMDAIRYGVYTHTKQEFIGFA